jgi:hypothetical protein
MSEVVEIPKSVRQIVEGLSAARTKQQSILVGDRFLKTQTDIDLEFNWADFPNLVSIMDTAEGNKVHLNSIADTAEKELREHNVLYIGIVNGHIKYGTYDASIRTNLLMLVGSPDLPEMITRAQVLNVSDHIKSANLVLIAAGKTPPLDFTAAQNDLLNIDLVAKSSAANEATEDFIGKATTVAIRQKICKTLLITIRKEVQFHVVDYAEPAMRVYCGLWGIKYRILKVETEVDILFVWADGTGIVPGAHGRIAKLETSEGKESVQGVKGIANAHAVLILDTTQTGEDLFIIYEMTGAVPGHVACPITAGEDVSVTIHLVRA